MVTNSSSSSSSDLEGSSEPEAKGDEEPEATAEDAESSTLVATKDEGEAAEAAAAEEVVT